MSKLTSKIAVITGGASGIGLATARRFIAEGAFVYPSVFSQQANRTFDSGRGRVPQGSSIHP